MVMLCTTMSFFFNKFTVCKIPSRKNIGFHTDNVNPLEMNEPIRINLGENEYVFSTGKWVLASRLNENFQDQSDDQQLQIIDLKEENNLLQLKTDLLLDMLTNVTSENQMKEREINRLRLEIVSRKHSRH